MDAAVAGTVLTDLDSVAVGLAVLEHRSDQADWVVLAVNQAYRRLGIFPAPPELPTSLANAVGADFAKRLGLLAISAIESGGCITGEYGSPQGGDRRWRVVMTPQPLGDRSATRVIATISDVTAEWRASRAREDAGRLLESAFGVASVGLCVADGVRRIIRVNAAFADLLGCDRDEVIGRDLLDFLPKDERARARRFHASLRAGQVDGRAGEWRLLRADGSLLDVQIGGGRFLAAGGEVFTLMTIVDIGDRLRIEADMRAAIYRAEAASEAKSAFLANMSHELRTPLNAVIGFSEIIKDEILGAVTPLRYREYAADIHMSGRHLLSIVNDLLDMAKIEAGKLTLNEERVHLADLFVAVLRITRGRAEEAGLHLDQRIQAGLDRVECDSRLIRQVLINLVSNAIRFTPAGGRILLEAVGAPGESLYLIVSDTGTGIAPENLETALAPFGQVGDAVGKGGGTGLGLPISKAIAEEHGGDLFINSVDGAGTSVFVVLPAHRMIDPPDIAADAHRGLARFVIGGEAVIDLVERLGDGALDRLPIGVIRVDRTGRILAYNATERRFTGFGSGSVIGRNFFTDIAPCTGQGPFRDRFEEGMRRGDLDAVFSYTFQFPGRRVPVLVHLARAKAVDEAWIFVRWT